MRNVIQMLGIVCILLWLTDRMTFQLLLCSPSSSAGLPSTPSALCSFLSLFMDPGLEHLLRLNTYFLWFQVLPRTFFVFYMNAIGRLKVILFSLNPNPRLGYASHYLCLPPPDFWININLLRCLLLFQLSSQPHPILCHVEKIPPGFFWYPKKSAE